jgi:hypothetical protein
MPDDAETLSVAAAEFRRPRRAPHTEAVDRSSGPHSMTSWVGGVAGAAGAAALCSLVRRVHEAVANGDAELSGRAVASPRGTDQVGELRGV